MKNTQRGFLGIAILVVSTLGLLASGIYFYSKTKLKITYAPEALNNPATTASSSISNESESNEKVNITSTSTVTAYISSIEGNKITLDYFDALSGEDAKKAVVADGRCSQKQVDSIDGNNCFNNGILYDRNQNPKLRTFTISVDVQVITASNFKKSSSGITNISVQELKKDFVDIYTDEGQKINIPYKITLNSKSEVTKIEEIFRP